MYYYLKLFFQLYFYDLLKHVLCQIQYFYYFYQYHNQKLLSVVVRFNYIIKILEKNKYIFYTSLFK